MKTKPLVSIIMPTHNRADKIMTAINSVLNQTYSHIELLVVDDGSTDHTAALLQSNTHIRYIQQEHGGQAKARNTGLANAHGSIIASLDSDDLWYPQFLEKCVDKLMSDDFDFVFANWDQETRHDGTFDFLSNDIFIQPYFPKMTDGWVNLTYGELRTVYLQGCPSPSSSLIIKKSSIENGWNPDIKIGDDWFMYLNVILTSKRKAAFTLDRLWRKRIDQINIYDGRKRSDVLEYLYISDLDKMIRAFKHKLNPGELKFLKNKHVYSLVELAKHRLIREFNVSTSRKLLSRSLGIDPVYTLRCIPEVISFGMRRKLGRHQFKKDRPH